MAKSGEEESINLLTRAGSIDHLAGADNANAQDGAGRINDLTGAGRINDKKRSDNTNAQDGAGRINDLKGAGRINDKKRSDNTNAQDGAGRINDLKGAGSINHLSGAGRINDKKRSDNANIQSPRNLGRNVQKLGGALTLLGQIAEKITHLGGQHKEDCQKGQTEPGEVGAKAALLGARPKTVHKGAKTLAKEKKLQRNRDEHQQQREHCEDRLQEGHVQEELASAGNLRKVVNARQGAEENCQQMFARQDVALSHLVKDYPDAKEGMGIFLMVCGLQNEGICDTVLNSLDKDLGELRKLCIDLEKEKSSKK